MHNVSHRSAYQSICIRDETSRRYYSTQTKVGLAVRWWVALSVFVWPEGFSKYHIFIFHDRPAASLLSLSRLHTVEFLPIPFTSITSLSKNMVFEYLFFLFPAFLRVSGHDSCSNFDLGHGNIYSNWSMKHIQTWCKEHDPSSTAQCARM